MFEDITQKKEEKIEMDNCLTCGSYVPKSLIIEDGCADQSCLSGLIDDINSWFSVRQLSISQPPISSFSKYKLGTPEETEKALDLKIKITEEFNELEKNTEFYKNRYKEVNRDREELAKLYGEYTDLGTIEEFEDLILFKEKVNQKNVIVKSRQYGKTESSNFLSVMEKVVAEMLKEQYIKEHKNNMDNSKHEKHHNNKEDWIDWRSNIDGEC